MPATFEPPRLALAASLLGGGVVVVDGESLSNVCDFCGISYSKTIIGLSAKLALRGRGTPGANLLYKRQRGRAPPVMPPSITSSAPVM